MAGAAGGGAARGAGGGAARGAGGGAARGAAAGGAGAAMGPENRGMAGVRGGAGAGVGGAGGAGGAGGGAGGRGATAGPLPADTAAVAVAPVTDAVTGNTLLHTAQRARTPPAGTLAGSTRYTVSHDGQVTFI